MRSPRVPGGLAREGQHETASLGWCSVRLRSSGGSAGESKWQVWVRSAATGNGMANCKHSVLSPVSVHSNRETANVEPPGPRAPHVRM